MKLKPCPFCGGKAKASIIFETIDSQKKQYLWRVICHTCGSSSAYDFAEEKVVEKWNTRAEPDPVEFSPEWLKSERQRHGLSKNELGRRIGVSSTSIRKWENGQCRPKELAMRKLKNEFLQDDHLYNSLCLCDGGDTDG